MLKLFRPIILLSTVSLSLIAQVAFSQITTNSTRRLLPSPSSIDSPNCYMQTIQGRTLNLDNLCGKQSRTVTTTNTVTNQGMTSDQQLSEAEIKDLINQVCQIRDECPLNLTNVDIGVIRTR